MPITADTESTFAVRTDRRVACGDPVPVSVRRRFMMSQTTEI
jgi:hypothetical protein